MEENISSMRMNDSPNMGRKILIRVKKGSHPNKRNTLAFETQVFEKKSSYCQGVLSIIPLCCDDGGWMKDGRKHLINENE